MSAKKRKGIPPWSACDYCNVIIAQKDGSLHKEKSCPPDLQTWVHPFILDETLYATSDVFNLQDKNLQHVPKEKRNDFILMPCHVLQLCKIPIGDPVLVQISSCHQVLRFVKQAWPSQEKISDFTVAISTEVAGLYELQPKSEVIVSKIQEKIAPAKCVTIVCVNNAALSDMGSLFFRLQKQNTDKIYSVGSKLLIRHFGTKAIFEIVDITSFTNKEVSSPGCLYLITLETKWKINNTVETKKEKPRNLIDKLGGLNSVIMELKDIISLGLSGKNIFSGLYITRGVLIYGPAGTGKTTLMEGLAEHFTNNIVRIECSKIFSKFIGDTEKELQCCFDQARRISPVLILIDDIDVLCSKSSSSSEFEKRITATLSLLMDRLNSEIDTPAVVLATTSRIHQIDKMLRCPSRFGKEVEIYVPSSPQRYEIFKLLLSDISHSLDEDSIKSIADSSHGFVGSDLVCLISKAVLKNYKTSQGRERVSLMDFQWALGKVKPSAMREIMVEVPNVKWSDIGGQDELKLKLRQCVEWPLKYGEAFTRLGIVPPKGVLMFGPPGCSKTMIAKALATESKLNFISVKGPELFSKWVGESERAVRKVFRRARQAAPSIIFFDELDAIGGERNVSSGSNVQDRVLAQLLTELDGVESLDNVTVVAATNRLDRIDPALIRPGRLDRVIYVPLPDQKTREEIFALQLRKTSVGDDVILSELVDKTDGYSGAEIIAVCREAALKALEENINAEIVTRKNFMEALNIVVPRTPKSLLEMYDKYILK